MKLTELSFRNIISYGNALQHFSFSNEPQLILVEGENGAGKSSIKEALTVSIYGRSAIRKMKDIPNWINRNAYTSIKFITNSGERIEIDRGIDPNFSNIRINDAEYNLPDKRKVDDFIEEELVKIPFSVFCNTISLSFDDFKSFVNLSQSDKRKIVDRIFGIDILSDMRAEVREELKDNRKEIEIIDSEILKNKGILEKSINQLSILKEKLSKKQEDKTSDLSLKIESKKTTLEETRKKYLDFKKSAEEVQKNIDSVKDKMSKLRASISELTNKLAIYQKNRCPHCLNDLTSDSSIKIKEQIETRKKVLEEDLPKLSSELSGLVSKLSTFSNDQNSTKEEFYKIEADLNSLKSELEKAKSDIVSDETESINKIISSIQSEISNDENRLGEQKERLNLYSVLDELLSDSGIKKTLIDKIIPTLNSIIQEVSDRLEFKFNFTFDSDFNPIIEHLGMLISPDCLSSGQRKKMNLIVILAFIKLIKMKHNQMNVMFLDEIFASLDKNNVYMAIEMLREYADEYNMTIFVVSHESLPEEFFNRKILVSNKDHFSHIEIIDTKKPA